MKIRTGFVSNSSASSFTIYGWSEKDLAEHISTFCPAFEGTDITVEDEFFYNIQKAWEGHDWDITEGKDANGYEIFGLGESQVDIDHNHPIGNGPWEEFKYPEPSDEDKEKFNKLAEKLKLPKPKIYQRTWFNG